MLDRVAYIVTQGVIFNLSIDPTTYLHCGSSNIKGSAYKDQETMVTILRGIVALMVSNLIFQP